MKFLSRFVRSLGILLIAAFCGGAIFGTFEIKNWDTLQYDGNIMIKTLQVLEALEEKAFDLRANLHHDETDFADNPILVEIDDESLQAIGTYPFSREYYVKMIQKLQEYGAKVIAFDVMFPEESNVCAGVSEEDNVDTQFANAITNFNDNGGQVIIAYTVQRVVDQPIEPSLSLLTSMLSVQGVSEEYDSDKGRLVASNTDIYFQQVDGHTWPIDKIVDTGTNLGYINNEEDFDGVYRHYGLYARLLSKELEGSLFVPALGLRAYLSSLDESEFKLQIQSDSTGIITIDNKDLHVSKNAQVKIKWDGAQLHFPSISFIELINSKNMSELKNKNVAISLEKYQKDLADLDPADPNYEANKAEYERKIKILEPRVPIDLRGKIVFVGSSAIGAHDMRNTPIDPTLPGVYAHMNIAKMFLNNSFYKRYEPSLKFSLQILLGTMLALVVVMLFNKALLDFLALLILLGGVFAADYYYFLPQGYEIRMVFIFLGLVTSYSYITLLNFNQASAEKKQIKGAFSRYVAPAVVDDMLDNPDKLKVGGERKDITCLFSDVRDFTSISEQLTPTELASALNRYMGEMTDIVFETNGTLDKYIGDAIVAFWGAPIDIGDHVNQAMDGAVRMLEALPAINAEFREKNLPEFKIGLGLNSGICSVGNMGSDAIFAYTALGDNMNLGARLESLCKHYGAQILVSEFTYEKMDRERFISRCIDKVRVKGKTEPVGVYEVLYSYHPLMLNPEALEQFRQGYALYLEGKFGQAKALFEKVLEVVDNDKASLRLRESCEHWMANPPQAGDDWTITTMTTK